MDNKNKVMAGNKTIDQWYFILFQFFVPVAFGLYSVFIGQDTNWDLQNYHLYNPYAFLNHRFNLDLLPDGMNTCFNPYLDLVYFELIRHLAPWVVGFILGFVQGLNFVVLLHIGKYCLKPVNPKYLTWSIPLAYLGVLSVGFLSELGTVYWDNLVSLFPLVALLIVVKSMGSIISGTRRALYLTTVAGIIAGLGAGLKPVVTLYALSLFLSFLFIPMPLKRKLLFSVFLAAGLLAGFLVIDGAWLMFIWQQMGNPIFPLKNNIFHGRLALDTPIGDYRFLPRSFFELIFYPAVFTVNPLRVGEQAYSQINCLIVYLTSVFFFFRVAFNSCFNIQNVPFKPEVKYLLLFFWFSYLFWVSTFGLYRYQITFEILIPLVVFVLIVHLFDPKPLTQALVISMLGFVTLFNLKGLPDWGHSHWAPKVYRFETRWAQEDKIDSVILIGMPLAWIIPALDIKKPFIQIMPNFQVNEAYAQKVQDMLKDSRDGRVLVIFDPGTINPVGAERVLKRYDFVVNGPSCTNEGGYIGTRRFNYIFCPAGRISHGGSPLDYK